MQNHMGLSRNTGTFDPNRDVEGDIFRIGMHLEDIKEMIDRNISEQISPPRSSSTPTSVKDLLDMKPLCMSTPFLHEVIMLIVASVFWICADFLLCGPFQSHISGLKHSFWNAASKNGDLERRSEQDHEGGQQTCHIPDKQWTQNVWPLTEKQSMQELPVEVDAVVALLPSICTHINKQMSYFQHCLHSCLMAFKVSCLCHLWPDVQGF